MLSWKATKDPTNGRRDEAAAVRRHERLIALGKKTARSPRRRGVSPKREEEEEATATKLSSKPANVDDDRESPEDLVFAKQVDFASKRLAFLKKQAEINGSGSDLSEETGDSAVLEEGKRNDQEGKEAKEEPDDTPPDNVEAEEAEADVSSSNNDESDKAYAESTEAAANANAESTKAAAAAVDFASRRMAFNSGKSRPSLGQVMKLKSNTGVAIDQHEATPASNENKKQNDNEDEGQEQEQEEKDNDDASPSNNVNVAKVDFASRRRALFASGKMTRHPAPAGASADENENAAACDHRQEDASKENQDEKNSDQDQQERDDSAKKAAVVDFASRRMSFNSGKASRPVFLQRQIATVNKSAPAIEKDDGVAAQDEKAEDVDLETAAEKDEGDDNLPSDSLVSENEEVKEGSSSSTPEDPTANNKPSQTRLRKRKEMFEKKRMSFGTSGPFASSLFKRASPKCPKRPPAAFKSEEETIHMTACPAQDQTAGAHDGSNNAAETASASSSAVEDAVAVKKRHSFGTSNTFARNLFKRTNSKQQVVDVASNKEDEEADNANHTQEQAVVVDDESNDTAEITSSSSNAVEDADTTKEEEELVVEEEVPSCPEPQEEETVSNPTQDQQPDNDAYESNDSSSLFDLDAAVADFDLETPSNGSDMDDAQSEAKPSNGSDMNDTQFEAKSSSPAQSVSNCNDPFEAFESKWSQEAMEAPVTEGQDLAVFGSSGAFGVLAMDDTGLGAFESSDAFHVDAAMNLGKDREDLAGAFDSSNAFNDDVFGGNDGAFECDTPAADQKVAEFISTSCAPSASWSVHTDEHQFDNEDEKKESVESSDSSEIPLQQAPEPAPAPAPAEESEEDDGFATKVKSFHTGLAESEQRNIFSEIVVYYDTKLRKFEETSESKNAELEYLKGELTNQHDQILMLVEKDNVNKNEKEVSDENAQEEEEEEGNDNDASSDQQVIVALNQELAELRAQLEEANVAAVHLRWENSQRGNKKLKKGVRNANKTLSQGVKKPNKTLSQSTRSMSPFKKLSSVIRRVDSHSKMAMN